MERYEMLNRMTRPIDMFLEAELNLLKRLGLYETVKGLLSNTAKTMLGSYFNVYHQIEVVNSEVIPKEGGFILASNHQSWFDAQILGAVSPRRLRFITKDMLYQFSVLRHVLELFDSLRIRRGGDPEGMRLIGEALKGGDAVAIFPEGTIPGEEDVPRSAVEYDTGLLPGKTGAVRLAIEARAPVYPVGISGAGKSFPPEYYPRMEKFPLIKPIPITVRFGNPIEFSDLYDSVGKIDKRKLKSATKRIMKSISSLVDHSRNYIPISVPLDDPPWGPTKEIERKGGDNKMPGVLVLHGFTSSLKTVDGLAPMLTQNGFDFLMPLLRGHGTRYQDLEGVTHQDWYEDAEAAMKRLLRKHDSVFVVGLSMGGLVALELAAKYPDKTAGTVLAAPALRFKNPLTRIVPVMKKFVKYWSSPNSFNSKELSVNNRNYEKFPIDAFASLYEYTGKIEKLLPEIKVPVLILQSHKDNVVDPKAAQEIWEKIGSEDKELVWFKQTGHEMFQDMEADQVIQVVEDYLRRKTER